MSSMYLFIPQYWFTVTAWLMPQNWCSILMQWWHLFSYLFSNDSLAHAIKIWRKKKTLNVMLNLFTVCFFIYACMYLFILKIRCIRFAIDEIY